jgi:hypothetical protein
MDTGEPCYIDYESQRHLEFERLVKRAYEVANSDKLFEEEREKVRKFKPSSKEFISKLDQHYGDVFYMAANIRREKEFYNKHGRSETLLEFLNVI